VLLRLIVDDPPMVDVVLGFPQAKQVATGLLAEAENGPLSPTSQTASLTHSSCLPRVSARAISSLKKQTANVGRPPAPGSYPGGSTRRACAHFRPRFASHDMLRTHPPCVRLCPARVTLVIRALPEQVGVTSRVSRHALLLQGSLIFISRLIQCADRAQATKARPQYRGR
jgi:hypothetical protein